MNRRRFIKNSAALMLPALINGFAVKGLNNHLLNAVLKGTETGNDRVLVLVQLFGGNDGLNSFVPLDIYSKYFNARSNIAIEEKKVLPISGISSAGFHPSLTGFRDLYNEGKMAVIQSVGYPNPDFSHFRSADIWMSGADADQHILTGWLGRYLNNKYPEYPDGYPNSLVPHPLAIQVGSSTCFAFQGYKAPVAVNIEGTSEVFNLTSGFTDPVPAGRAGKALNFLRTTAQQTQSYSEVVSLIAGKVTEQAAYPENNPLANQLKIVARLIKGGMNTKIYFVSFDGFDHHAGQVTPGATSTGSHADLLQIVGDAVKSFQQDLEFLGVSDSVMGMTISEFGRRIISNNSFGTDHGAAAPLFVFGNKVKGSVIGHNPDIPDHVTNDDNIAMQTDYRSVYLTVMEDWLGVPHTEAAVLFPHSFDKLNFINENAVLRNK